MRDKKKLKNMPIKMIKVLLDLQINTFIIKILSLPISKNKHLKTASI